MVGQFEKPKHEFTTETTPVNARSFFYWWMIGNVMLGPVIFLVGFMPGLAMFSLLITAQDAAGVTPLKVELVAGGAFGLIIGFAIGFIQDWVMDRWYYGRVEHWMLLSTIGGILGGMMAVPIVNTLDNVLIPMILFMTCISLVQWAALRAYVDKAWLWVLAKVSGGVVFAVLYGNWLLAVVLLGVITGAIMLWLFEYEAYDWVFERYYARFASSVRG